MNYQYIRQILNIKIREQINYSQDMTDEDVLEIIDRAILEEREIKQFPIRSRQDLRQDLFNSLRRLDILQHLIDDNSITEIMINGPDSIFIEQNGKLSKSKSKFDSTEKLLDVIQKIVAGCNRSVNESSPIVDARLYNGARVNIIMNPIALNGPIVTIRRFPDSPITMEDLVQRNAVTKEASDFLKTLVKAKYNIIISGGTGSGKTTFLNVLSGFIDKEERVVTIEDSAELQLQGLKNIVRLETRNETADGCLKISMRDLIKASLRLRPDRIIVGEVRGKEAVDMMVCLNTGHSGSMSTVHANNAVDTLGRLENMMLMGLDIPISAIKGQITSGVNIIVHLGRLRDKSRKVLEIIEITGYKDGVILTNPLFEFQENGVDESGNILGNLVHCGRLYNERKLKAAGLQL